jgi:hypothetical protein
MPARPGRPHSSCWWLPPLMESSNPRFQHEGTLAEGRIAAEAAATYDTHAALAAVAAWGASLGSEPRAEGKLVDAVTTAAQRADCAMVLAVLRAGRPKILVSRAALEAVWQLCIGRDLHEPDSRGHGQFAMDR